MPYSQVSPALSERAVASLYLGMAKKILILPCSEVLARYGQIYYAVKLEREMPQHILKPIPSLNLCMLTCPPHFMHTAG